MENPLDPIARIGIAEKFLPEEKRKIAGLSGLMFFRMFGVFVLLPVFSVYALEMPLASATLVGLAYGGYGLTQAFFQIPFGLLSDRWTRRKALILGFGIFALGCVVSALAGNIYLMILGRLLQGMGAVSSTLIAFMSDQVRKEFQTRAMAAMGISIGMAFAVAFSVSPFLAGWAGLPGIFWLLAGVSVIVMLVLFFMAEAPQGKSQHLPTFAESIKFLGSHTKDQPITLPLFTNFIISFGLSVYLFNIPLFLQNFHWAKKDSWQFYLPMLFLGGVCMIPSAIWAEKYKKFKSVYLIATLGVILANIITILAISDIGLSFTQAWIIVGGYLYFISFNCFEPLLPSLVMRSTPKNQKGVASGILSFCQFIGQFFGAMVAGLGQNFWHPAPFVLVLLLSLVLLVWTVNSRSFRIFPT